MHSKQNKYFTITFSPFKEHHKDQNVILYDFNRTKIQPNKIQYHFIPNKDLSVSNLNKLNSKTKLLHIMCKFSHNADSPVPVEKL